MRGIAAMLAGASLIALSACDKAAPNKDGSVEMVEASPATADPQLPEREFIEVKLSSGAAQLVAGQNAFAVSLYKAMAGGQGDVFISPASISTAFSLAQAGARGDTAEEIAKTLHFPPGDMHAAMGEWLATLDIQARGRTMMVNNAIWVQKDFAIVPAYAALVKQHYRAGLNTADFAGDPGAARDAINAWVAAHTRNRIQGFLRAEDFHPDNRAMLVNTAYFKAAWANVFEPQATKSEDFTRADGTRVKMPLMNQQHLFGHFETPEGVKGVALPYAAGEYGGQGEAQMVILLPNQAAGLAAMEAGLTDEKLRGWMTQLDAQGGDVILTVPKFKIGLRAEMNPALERLGLRLALSDSADFSGMTADPIKDPLKLGKIIHQTFVEVDELGTEAAAATAIAWAAAGAAMEVEKPKPFIFRADHPFLFLIRDTRTGAILFMGRFTGTG